LAEVNFFDGIEAFCDRRRRLGRIGGEDPEAFEAATVRGFAVSRFLWLGQVEIINISKYLCQPCAQTHPRELALSVSSALCQDWWR
jgi:hypothetical protein